MAVISGRPLDSGDRGTYFNIERLARHPMNHDRYSDDYIRRIFAGVKTIAMVGASPRSDRPSYRVMRFLQSKGFRVIPVNPQAAGESINGETVRASLSAI